MTRRTPPPRGLSHAPLLGFLAPSAAFDLLRPRACCSPMSDARFTVFPSVRSPAGVATPKHRQTTAGTAGAFPPRVTPFEDSPRRQQPRLTTPLAFWPFAAQPRFRGWLCHRHRRLTRWAPEGSRRASRRVEAPNRRGQTGHFLPVATSFGPRSCVWAFSEARHPSRPLRSSPAELSLRRRSPSRSHTARSLCLRLDGLPPEPTVTGHESWSSRPRMEPRLLRRMASPCLGSMPVHASLFSPGPWDLPRHASRRARCLPRRQRASTSASLPRLAGLPRLRLSRDAVRAAGSHPPDPKVRRGRPLARHPKMPMLLSMVLHDAAAAARRLRRTAGRVAPLWPMSRRDTRGVGPAAVRLQGLDPSTSSHWELPVKEMLPCASSMGFSLPPARASPTLTPLSRGQASRSDTGAATRGSRHGTPERLCGGHVDRASRSRQQKRVRQRTRSTDSRRSLSRLFSVVPPVIRMSPWTYAGTVPTPCSRGNVDNDGPLSEMHFRWVGIPNDTRSEQKRPQHGASLPMGLVFPLGRRVPPAGDRRFAAGRHTAWPMGVDRAQECT